MNDLFIKHTMRPQITNIFYKIHSNVWCGALDKVKKEIIPNKLQSVVSSLIREIIVELSMQQPEIIQLIDSFGMRNSYTEK